MIKYFKPRLNSVKPISQAKVAYETLWVGRFIYTLNLPTEIQQMLAEKTDSWISQLPVIDKIVRPSVYYPFCFGVTASSLRWVQRKFFDFPVPLLWNVVPVMSLRELFYGTVECHVSCGRFYLARLYQWFQQIGKTYVLCILFKKQKDTPVSYTHLTLPTTPYV